MSSPTVQYLHSSFAGTYAVDCEILEKGPSGYKILFRDPIIDEDCTRWVRHESLVFPDFGDTVI